MSGMIAGGMTKTNKIGMVGGYPIPEVNRLMNAFMAGAKEVNPKVEFMVTFINSWFDPPKAKEAAFAMIDKGADVMYAERFGVSDAARRKLAIGNVINTQDKYPDTVVAQQVEQTVVRRSRRSRPVLSRPTLRSPSQMGARAASWRRWARSRRRCLPTWCPRYAPGVRSSPGRSRWWSTTAAPPTG